MNTTDILKGEVPRLDSMEDLRALWFVVYDGPVAWRGRTAFEEIEHSRRRPKAGDICPRCGGQWKPCNGGADIMHHCMLWAGPIDGR